jgi:REP element-mobilizing transposase RayT
MNHEQHNRHSIRLKGYDYSQAGSYFVTICTQNRECIFGEILDGEMILNNMGKIVENEWVITEQLRANVNCGKHVIMPNHFHGIVVITDGWGTARRAPTKDLDTGFRVLKVDSSNMADVYYSPDKVKQGALFKDIDNIKDDRTTEDLLFQVLLDWGVDLTLPITKETIADREVFFVDGNALAACFVKNSEITEDFCKELAKRHPLRVVFRNSGFKDDSVKINVEQIFKLMSPHTEVKTI